MDVSIKLFSLSFVSRPPRTKSWRRQWQDARAWVDGQVLSVQ